MRIIAILAAYNEERYIGACMEHYAEQGVDVYLIDNSSTDRTVKVAEEHKGRNLVGIENAPREGGVHRWYRLLERKEDLAQSLDADWFIHADPDEIRLPPTSSETLAGALARVDDQGYNAVNFMEFTFIPTRESPDHDHPDFQKTMRWYYPFHKHFPYRINAWKRQPDKVNLTRSGGHRVRFPNQLLYPESFKMRHYQFLSLLHSRQKYLENKQYPPEEVKRGLHGWRARMDEERFRLPSQRDLHVYVSDDELSVANPRVDHVIANWTRPGNGKDGARSEPEADPDDHGVSRGGLPVIVGGCNRLGTSLLGRVLNAHSQFDCGAEVGFFRDFYDDSPGNLDAREHFLDSARRVLPEPQLLRVLGKALVRMRLQAARRANKARWVDQNPDNALYLEGWQTLLGDDWLFVHVVDNPLDAIASMASTNSAAPIGLDARIELYKRSVEAGLEFGERHPDRYYRVIHEQVSKEPESVIPDLMDWLEAPLEPVQLNLGEGTAAEREGAEAYKAALAPKETEKISRECDSLYRRVSGNTDSEPVPRRKGLLGRLKRSLGG